MRHGNIILLIVLLATLFGVAESSAQSIRRGPKTFVRDGQLVRPDTAALRTDSLNRIAVRHLLPDSAAMMRLAAIENLTQHLVAADTAALDSIRRSIPASDTHTLEGFDALHRQFDQADSMQRRHLAFEVERTLRLDAALLDSLHTGNSLIAADTSHYKKRGFISDSMSLSKVCWISLVLPGYGQIYNKQYWKLPILYGTFGTALGLFIHENSIYKPLKREFETLTGGGTFDRTPEIDALQTKMIRSNTRRQLYLGATIASYIYFIGDAAVKYSTNDVSHVKKATTLACICPGAGQIYNKSYWKVPFVVGGFAALIYCIDWNNRGFQRFKKAYNLRTEWDKQDPTTRPTVSPDEFHGSYSADFLKNLKDSNRRNRDLCIIATAGVYLLQIVDAHVDAHLRDYDISDDLTMNIEPKFDYAFVPSQGRSKPVFGFNLSLTF